MRFLGGSLGAQRRRLRGLLSAHRHGRVVLATSEADRRAGSGGAGLVSRDRHPTSHRPGACRTRGQLPPDFDTTGVAAALGLTGTSAGGIYKITIPRADTITEDGRVLPAGLGLTTGVNFQPLGGGKAAINGDLVMTADQVHPVIAALRRGGIAIVELHNHGLTEQPRLFYLHFWAVNDAVALFTAMRAALDATHLTPPH